MANHQEALFSGAFDLADADFSAVSCFYYFFSFFFNLPDQTFTANRLHTTTARQTAVNVSSIANTAGKADHHDQPLTHRPAAAHRVFFRSSFFSAWD